jgi:hypothetical protein
VQERVARADHPVEARLVQAQLGQEHLGLVRLQLAISSSILAEITTWAAPCASAISATRALWALPVAASSSATLQTIEDGLGGQKLKHLPRLLVLLGDLDHAGGLAVLQRGARLHQAFLLHRLLVAAAHLADDVLQPLLDALQIGQHQLGLDGLGIGDGIDAALHMGHVAILETAQDMGDGVDLADIGEELVAEPLPLDAPFTRPAMSTKVMRAGMTCFDLAISASLSSRGSGTATSPTLGSIVQKGKFAACAAAVRVSALNSVDLPTFGRPTIPTLKPMSAYPLRNRRLYGGASPRGIRLGARDTIRRWQPTCRRTWPGCPTGLRGDEAMLKKGRASMAGALCFSEAFQDGRGH